MKRLLVMRHAKSSWKDESLADHDRPLNQRGLRDAPRIGEYLVDQQLDPAITISSTAVRALRTAELVVDSFPDDHQLITDHRLYHASASVFGEVLGEYLEDEASTLVISHNPGCEEWVYQLTGQFVTLPTAAVAVIEMASDTPWMRLNQSVDARLSELLRPKEIF